jgi:hypothetical protein
VQNNQIKQFLPNESKVHSFCSFMQINTWLYILTGTLQDHFRTETEKNQPEKTSQGDQEPKENQHKIGQNK